MFLKHAQDDLVDLENAEQALLARMQARGHLSESSESEWDSSWLGQEFRLNVAKALGRANARMQAIQKRKETMEITASGKSAQTQAWKDALESAQKDALAEINSTIDSASDAAAGWCKVHDRLRDFTPRFAAVIKVLEHADL